MKDRILAEIKDDEVVQLAKDLVRIPSDTTEETPERRRRRRSGRTSLD